MRGHERRPFALASQPLRPRARIRRLADPDRDRRGRRRRRFPPRLDGADEPHDARGDDGDPAGLDSRHAFARRLRQGCGRLAGGKVLPQFGDHRHDDDLRDSHHQPSRWLRIREIQVPRRDAVFALVVATMFLPPIVTLIPLYRLVGYLRIDGGLMGVIAPNLANAFGIFLMRQFISGVPDDLIDAGRMDGASELRILFSIVAPSVTPAIAALALFAFVYHWNSYLWPLTVLEGHTENYPIVISLSRLLSYNRGAMNTNLVMAGATLAVLPPLILFAFLQRLFVDSIVSTGIRG